MDYHTSNKIRDIYKQLNCILKKVNNKDIEVNTLKAKSIQLGNASTYTLRMVKYIVLIR